MKERQTAIQRIVLLFWTCVWTASGATLGTYEFSGFDPDGDTALPLTTNLVFSTFQGTNVAAVPEPDILRLDDWTLGGVLDAGEYVEFTLAPAVSYELSLTTLSFDVQRSVDKATPREKDGPQDVELRVYQGSGLTLVNSQPIDLSIGGWQTVTVNFGNLTNLVGETLTFRLYAWNSAHHNGWLDIDNVTLMGSVAPALVPEPSPAALFSCGLFILCAQWTRRRA